MAINWTTLSSVSKDLLVCLRFILIHIAYSESEGKTTFILKKLNVVSPSKNFYYSRMIA